MVGRMTVLRIVIVLVIDNSVTKSYLGVKERVPMEIMALPKSGKGGVRNKNASEI
jgi:hypothetical protein